MAHVSGSDSRSMSNSYDELVDLQGPQLEKPRSHFFKFNPKSYFHRNRTATRPSMISRAKYQLMARQRSERKRLFWNAISLLFSWRTILVQLESFLCIYLVRVLDKDSNQGHNFTRHFGLSVDLKVIGMMVAFCVIFTISESFKRRERALQDIANFKSKITTMYFLFNQITATNNVHLDEALEICSGLFGHLTEYIYDRNPLMQKKLFSKEQQDAVHKFYGDINRLTATAYNLDALCYKDGCPEQKEDPPNKVYLPHSAPLVLFNKIDDLLSTFERLCATKDYLTPTGIRAFTNFMLWFLPIILSPYFVWHTDNDTSDFAGYLWAWLFFLILGSLVDITIVLDDIFDADSIEDDIVLSEPDFFHNIQYGSKQSLYHDKQM